MGGSAPANRGKSQLTLGTIEVEDDRAEVEVVSKGEVAPFKYVFTKEGGQWKHDMVAILEALNGAFHQGMRTKQNVQLSEDQLLLMALSMQFKKPVGPELWEKPQ